MAEDNGYKSFKFIIVIISLKLLTSKYLMQADDWSLFFSFHLNVHWSFKQFIYYSLVNIPDSITLIK